MSWPVIQVYQGVWEIIFLFLGFALFLFSFHPLKEGLMSEGGLLDTKGQIQQGGLKRYDVLYSISVLWNFWNVLLLGRVFCLQVPVLRTCVLAFFSSFHIGFYLAIALKQTIYRRLGADDLIKPLQMWCCCIPEKRNHSFSTFFNLHWHN